MKTTKRDVIWSYLARFFSLGVNIILLPLILHYLTDTELGLWYVYASIAQVVSLFDFGFNATISRHMSYAWSGAVSLKKEFVADSYLTEPNLHLAGVILGTCRWVYLVISVAALLVMSSLGTVYVKHIVGDAFTQGIMISWVIYMVAVFLNLFYGYWTSLLQGIGDVENRYKIGVYAKGIQIILAVLLLAFGHLGLLGFVVSYAISGVSLRLLGSYYFKRKTDGLDIVKPLCMADIRSCFCTMWITAWRDGLVMIAQYLSTQANTLVCAYFIDLSITSVYGLITQISTIIATLSGAYFSAFQPQLNSAYLHKNTALQKDIICHAAFVYKISFFLGMVLWLTMGCFILQILRPGIILEWPLIILVGITYYLFYQHSLAASMIASSNTIPYCKAFIISSIAAVVMSIIFVKYFNFGIYGLVLAQLLINAAYNNWYWPVFAMKKYGVKYADIYHRGVLLLKKWGKDN